MPLDSVQHSIHIRRKKNERVFQNIARLQDLGRKAQSHQDILDGLHPWNAPIVLKFENVLPLLLAALGLFFILLIFIDPSNIWMQLALISGLLMIFWAYISYEDKQPIDDVIEFLEQQSINKKYQLALHQQPQHISVPLQPVLFIAHLKRLFPVFNQGTISNDLPYYASTVWEDKDSQQHQVMVFQYHYVNEMLVRDKNGDDVRVKEIHKDLWGVFVFDVNTVYKHKNVLGNNTFVFDEEDFSLSWDNEYLGDNTVRILLDFFVYNGKNYDRFSEEFNEKAYSVNELKSVLNNFNIIGIYDELNLDDIKDDSERIYLNKKKGDN